MYSQRNLFVRYGIHLGIALVEVVQLGALHTALPATNETLLKNLDIFDERIVHDYTPDDGSTILTLQRKYGKIKTNASHKLKKLYLTLANSMDVSEALL